MYLPRAFSDLFPADLAIDSPKDGCYTPRDVAGDRHPSRLPPAQTSMRPFPRIAWIYIGSVAVAASILLISYLPLAVLRQPETLALAIVSVLAIVFTGTHGIPIRQHIRVTLTTVVIFADVLLFDVGTAAWVVAVGQAWVFIRLKRRWYNTLFNAAAYVLTVFGSGLIYQWIDDRPPVLLGSVANAFAVLAAADFYYLANTALVTLMVDLREGRLPSTTWIATLRRAGTEYFTLILLGVLAALLYRVNRPLILLVVVPAAIVFDAFRMGHELREQRDRLIDAEEAVRHQLQTDLHDGPAQSLAAMTMRASVASRHVVADPAAAARELAELEKELRDATRGVRTLLYELRPLVLESQGLPAALETYVAKLQQPRGPRIRLDFSGFSGRLEHRVEISLFGIVQEAVANALKHARASVVEITVAVKADWVTVSVRDDGLGFDPVQVDARYDQRGSFGLLHMRERAGRIGGELRVESAPGHGTTVSVSIPRTP